LVDSSIRGEPPLARRAPIAIALFGQAVLNGVVMVGYFNQLQDEGLNPYEAVLQGVPTLYLVIERRAKPRPVSSAVAV
jgi:hypothetical protein